MKDENAAWRWLMAQPRSKRIVLAVGFAGVGVLWLVDRFVTHSAVMRVLAIFLAPLFFLFAYIYVRSLLKDRER